MNANQLVNQIVDEFSKDFNSAVADINRDMINFLSNTGAEDCRILCASWLMLFGEQVAKWLVYFNSEEHASILQNFANDILDAMPEVLKAFEECVSRIKKREDEDVA